MFCVPSINLPSSSDLFFCTYRTFQWIFNVCNVHPDDRFSDCVHRRYCWASGVFHFPQGFRQCDRFCRAGHQCSWYWITLCTKQGYALKKGVEGLYNEGHYPWDKMSFIERKPCAYPKIWKTYVMEKTQNPKFFWNRSRICAPFLTWKLYEANSSKIWI